MEDNNIMIFNMGEYDTLDSLGLFTKDEIKSLNVELDIAKSVYAKYNFVAIDMESRRLVATDTFAKRDRTSAEYVNETYFIDKGAVMHNVEGSLHYTDAKYICLLDGELLWYRLLIEPEVLDPVKKAWRERNPDTYLYEAPAKHISPYVFNWSQYAQFGSRQSKITLFFLGYDTTNIKDTGEVTIDIKR